MLRQDRCRRQVSRQRAVRRQRVQTGFKTRGCRKTRGTKEGGCRPTDHMSCANTVAIMKKKHGRDGSAQRNHLYILANFTFLTAQKPQEHAQVRGVSCQKYATTGGGGAIGLILSGRTS